MHCCRHYNLGNTYIYICTHQPSCKLLLVVSVWLTQHSEWSYVVTDLKVLVKSTKIVFVYLFGRWSYVCKHLWFNKGNKTCFSGVFLGENIIITFSGSCFVDKMAVYFCFYPQTICIKWWFVHMYGNKQNTWDMEMA